ncbi:MAG: tetratricopeptide repeat protein [Oscillospiraceae bacterium]|nr:tetratricopeptide repeat protein [Oscillospiraceae bacterium]
MYNEIYCKQISMRLAELVAEVRQSSASNLHSINVHAENFFRAFLNQLFGWRLSNANAIEPNAAGVDLLYRGEAGDLVVQVSSTTTHEKIQKSLEKSARFPGAHFLFLAIDDHLPNYQKGFEKHGLVFDPKEDILDTTRLCDRVVNCGDRGALRAIDIQRALADLVENYFSRTEQLAQAELSTRLGQAVSAAPARQVGGQTLQLLGAGQPDNLFVYNARAVPLLGRDEDMKKLLDFVTDEPERRFCWWAVTAPGGAGKTRLAFELQNRLLETGQWEVYVLPPRLLRGEGTGLAELSAACPGKTLLLVDYVQQHTEALHTLLEALSGPGPDRREPLRLLLLERDIRDENGHIIWLDQVTGGDHHILAACQNRQPLYLKPLRRDAAGDPLAQIIRAFADKVCQTPDPEGKTLHPLPQGKEAALRDRLEAIDPELVRPLYALILADAWVRDPETEHWTREKLLSRLVDREWSLLEKRLTPYHKTGSRLFLGACRSLWQTVTVLGAGSGALTTERLEKLLPGEWACLKREAEANGASLESWTLSPAEVLLTKADLLEAGKLRPLRPDLLGEFFVMEGLVQAGDAERSAFYRAVLEDRGAVKTFFGRVLSDYGELLRREPRRLEALFPPEPSPDRETTDWYAWLLRNLFENCLDRALRAWLAHRLTALAAAQTREDAESGDICDNAASVLQDLGEYEKALAFFEKAVKLSEAALGPEHEDTATSYNNIALLYYDMGDYDKALESYDKSRKILEAVLGPAHPDTAATYNNLGLVYRAMGDYDKALEYYEKDRKISEAVLGPAHPDTAATYNNLGSVYQAMGDYDKALEFQEKARMIREAVLGPAHPDTATTYNNLASVYYAMGDYEKALEYYEKDRKISEAVLGPEHRDTATTYNNLGLVYRAMGDNEKALEFHEKSRNIREAVLGPAHPNTALTWQNMAMLYYKIHDLEQALRYSDKALAVFERVLGPEHPNTITVREDNEFLKQLSDLHEMLGDELWKLLEQPGPPSPP